MSAFEKYPFDIALMSKGKGEGCVITFPDLPGCAAEGATDKAAIAQARSAFHALTLEQRERSHLPRIPKSLRTQPSKRSSLISSALYESEK
jgi:predicted RNase H-like HicB family nuclease